MKNWSAMQKPPSQSLVHYSQYPALVIGHQQQAIPLFEPHNSPRLIIPVSTYYQITDNALQCWTAHRRSNQILLLIYHPNRPAKGPNLRSPRPAHPANIEKSKQAAISSYVSGLEIILYAHLAPQNPLAHNSYNNNNGNDTHSITPRIC